MKREMLTVFIIILLAEHILGFRYRSSPYLAQSPRLKHIPTQLISRLHTVSPTSTKATDMMTCMMTGSRTDMSAEMSTVAPPRPRTTTKPAPQVPDSPDIIFKESRDIQREFEEFFQDNNYYCILFDDPFNKRKYVEAVLMQVFSWTQAYANEVMMTAHNTGFAVTGEFAKDIAEQYADELKKHNLEAAAIPVKNEGDQECSTNE